MNPQLEGMRFVDIAAVLLWVEKTQNHGVPPRIAIKRAAKRFGADEGLIRAFVRTA